MIIYRYIYSILWCLFAYDLWFMIQTDQCTLRVMLDPFFFFPWGRDWWHVAVVGSSPGGMPWQARASLRSGRETQMVSQWVEGKISPGNMMKHCETLWNIINTVPTINGELWCVFFRRMMNENPCGIAFWGFRSHTRSLTLKADGRRRVHGCRPGQGVSWCLGGVLVVSQRWLAYII